MRDARTEVQNSLAFVGYFDALARGDHCLIDVDKVAIPPPDTASAANHPELLLERESDFIAGSKIVKPKDE